MSNNVLLVDQINDENNLANLISQITDENPECEIHNLDIYGIFELKNRNMHTVLSYIEKQIIQNQNSKKLIITIINQNKLQNQHEQMLFEFSKTFIHDNVNFIFLLKTNYEDSIYKMDIKTISHLMFSLSFFVKNNTFSDKNTKLINKVLDVEINPVEKSCQLWRFDHYKGKHKITELLEESDNSYKIKSVLRKDGVSFTLGDHTNYGVIISIELINNKKLIFVCNKKSKIKNLVKYDLVDIKETTRSLHKNTDVLFIDTDGKIKTVLCIKVVLYIA